MCNEREENGIFGGLMLKPSMVTTRNYNIVFKCLLFIFYISSRPNLSTHTKKGSIFIIFPLQSLGFQELKFLMENNCISC
jgi:hypothetical protein